MPGPVIADPTPDWMKPQNASVFDSPLQRVARWVGHKLGADDPQSQVAGIAAPMETGPVGGVVGAVQKYLGGASGSGIRAYHASPYDFDKFDLSKIGTGEGAQAYGHGLYFAEAPPTMEEYYKQFTNRARNQGIPYQGVVYPGGTDRHALLQDVADMGKDNAIANLKAQIGRNATYAPDRAALQQEHLKWLEQVDPAQVQLPTAHRYEVDIHADPSHLLDWDAPLEAQPSGVHDAIRKTPGAQETLDRIGVRQPRKDLPPEGPTGQTAWGAIADASVVGKRLGLTGNQIYRPGSEALLREGVPGIRYLDQASRLPTDPASIEQELGAYREQLERGMPSLRPYFQEQIDRLNALKTQPRTSNFTIFDDKLVSILRKFGVLPPLAAGAGYSASQQPQSQVGTPPPVQPPPR